MKAKKCTGMTCIDTYVWLTALLLLPSTGSALLACEGDANGDGAVDPLDAGFVAARFGCPVADGDTDCAAADQNVDGVVDPLDVGYVLARMGTCEPAKPMVGVGFSFTAEDLLGPVVIEQAYAEPSQSSDVISPGAILLSYRGYEVANGSALVELIEALPALAAGEVVELRVIPAGSSDVIDVVLVAEVVDDGLQTKEREGYECAETIYDNGSNSCYCITNKDDICWDTTIVEEGTVSKKTKRVTSYCKDLDSECSDPSPGTGA
jgi:hypothetical protein